MSGSRQRRSTHKSKCCQTWGILAAFPLIKSNCCSDDSFVKELTMNEKVFAAGLRRRDLGSSRLHYWPPSSNPSCSLRSCSQGESRFFYLQPTDISCVKCFQDEGFHDHAVTVLLVVWGQFIDHDVTLTSETRDPRLHLGNLLSCIDVFTRLLLLLV